MSHNIKTQEVSNIKQREDKFSRLDYSKLKVDFLSGSVGEEGKMKDSR